VARIDLEDDLAAGHFAVFAEGFHHLAHLRVISPSGSKRGRGADEALAGADGFDLGGEAFLDPVAKGGRFGFGEGFAFAVASPRSMSSALTDLRSCPRTC
jgi:hypothetical protein